MTLKSGQPTDIYPGQTTELVITVSNDSTTSEVANVGFNSNLPGVLPNGLQVADSATYICTNSTGSVPTQGTLTANVGTQTISLSGAVIPRAAFSAPPPPQVPTLVNGYCTITIPVTAGTSSGSAATYTYTIGSGAITGTENLTPVANSGVVSQSVNVRALSKPTISKNFASSTLVLGGDATTLTITIANNSPVAINNFSITDVFPELGVAAGIIKVANPPNPTSICTGAGTAPVFSPAAGDKTIAATGGTLAPNGSCTLTVQVEADHTNGAYTTGALSNVINASTQFINDLGIPAGANAIANITVNSPLGLTKSVNPPAIQSGTTGVFTITFSNSGNTPLNIVSFTDSPIDGLTGVGYGLLVDSSSTDCSGGVTSITAGSEGISLSGGTIPARGSCSVNINFTGTVQTAYTTITYTNAINQGAVDVGNAAIVSQSRSAAITVYDVLNIKKTVTPTNAAPGSAVRYTVTVENWSASALNNVVITDALTNGQTFLNGTVNGVNYTPTTNCNSVSTTSATGASTVVLTLGTIPPLVVGSPMTPGLCNVNFWVMTSTSGGTYSNQLGAGSVCAGAVCNGSGSGGASGTTVDTLVVAKNFSHGGTTHPPTPLVRPEGTIVRMAITLSNRSITALTNVNMADTLPVSGSEQLRLANPSNAATTCGGTITAEPGTSSVALNGGTVPARASSAGIPGTGADGTCAIYVDVVGAAGSYNNLATVTANQAYANNTVAPLSVSSNTATLTYLSTLSASKSFSPNVVSSGGRSTVRLQLSNSGAIALTNVAVTDPLPPGMVLAAPPNAYTTCAGSASINAVAGASSTSLSRALIAGNANCDFIFDVVATGSAHWVNTIPIGNITADGGVRNQTPISATLSYQVPVSLSVAKSSFPGTLTFPGQASQLTITINNGGTSVTGLSLTDYFTTDGAAASAPNGMVVAPTANASTTCPGGKVVAVPDARSISLSGVFLAANASCEMKVNVTSRAVGGVTNIIPVGSIVNDQGLSNSGQASTSLTTQTNVGVTKQFTPNVIKPGERSRLRITFFNPTAQLATNVSVIDTLPAGVTVPAGSNPSTSCVGATVSSPATNQVQVSGGNIAAASGTIAASCYAEIDVLVSTQGEYVNTIQAGAVTAVIGGGTVSNPLPTSDTLRAMSPLVVHKAFSGNTLDAGNPVGFTTGTDNKAPGTAATMTLRLDNPNAVALTATAFTDRLPTGMVVAPTPNAVTTCAGGTLVAGSSATTVSLTGATLPAAGFCTVTVDVLSNISGTYTNTIAANAVTTFEGVRNEEPTSARMVVSTPPTVSKQFVPAVISPGAISRLSIILSNSNSVPMVLSAPLVDTLPIAPGDILVAGTPNVVSTCGGAVTATADTGTISLASGGTIPAGGCTISLDVTGNTTGVHTNNIPAGALQTNFGNNQFPANSPLTISTQGFISGRVFTDNNVIPNGSYEAGTDTPLTGVGIELRSGTTCGGALVDSKATDTLGNYLFFNLPPGTYSVCEPIQPTGTNNGITTAGTITTVNGSTGTAGLASNPTTTTSQITGIVLNANIGADSISGSANNNFAEIVLSSISGAVFLDQNNSGTQNGADTGIPNVALEVSGYAYGTNGADNGGVGDDVTVSLSATTDASGNYTFIGLFPGKYTVTQPTQPAGASNGITTPGVVPNGGSIASASGVMVLPSRLTGIVLPPNTASTGNNFAEIPNGRTLSGRVFLDFNNNGSMDGRDYGLGAQTINLTGMDINGNAVSRSINTSTDGNYSFAVLPEGTFSVTQPNQPTGTTNGQTLAGSTGGVATPVGVVPSVILGINLTGANTVSANNNFAEVPGLVPDLTLTKSHTPAGFGEGSSTGYFTLIPSNIGLVATSGTISVVDTLPSGMTLAAPATGSGWTCSGSVGASTITCTTTEVMAPNGGVGNPITLRVAVANGTAGSILTNQAVVSCACEPTGFDGNNTAADLVPISSSARVGGVVWRDINHDRVRDSGEALMPNWGVELLLGGVVVGTTSTDSAGAYSFAAVAPGAGYVIRFRETASRAIYGYAVTNEQGIAPVNNSRDTGTNTPNSGSNSGNPAGADLYSRDGTLASLKFLAGDNIIQQSLPLDPSGVIYDSIKRQPVAGAVVEFGRLLAGSFTALPGDCLVGGTSSITTPTDGYYEFLLLPGPPAGCPGSGNYTLRVTPPGGYLPAPSSLIPACGQSGATGSASLSVGTGVSPVQIWGSAPPAGTPDHQTLPAACSAATPLSAVAQASTQYYYNFFLTLGVSGNIINNHIPIDPVLSGAIVMTKSSPLVNVNRAQLVPYTFTATNTLTASLPNVNIRDQIPPGFRYRAGSATLNGLPAEPTVSGRDLIWPNLTFSSGERKTWKMMLTVGSGVGEGLYTNSVWSVNNIINATISNIATATVRVVPDPTFDCSDIIGKVFDDKNANGWQDEGEPGIANVRLATARGLLVTTDAEGRFHVTCADIPQSDRGANFIMKLDERSLPSGYRLTTENPRDVRVTRGKMVKLNFGATVHRVVRLELDARAFSGDTVDLVSEWANQLASLPEKFKERPSVLRIAYRLTKESNALARQRLDSLAMKMQRLWQEGRKNNEMRQPLIIETELGGVR